MVALSKFIIAEELHAHIGLSRSDAKDLVDEFFANIKIRLEAGENVKLSGFGNFILRDKAERPGRNPKTGEAIPIIARRVVTFKSSLKLKKLVTQKND